MKNTSFSNLSVVTDSIPNKSFEVSKRARDILHNAKIFNSLPEAIANSNFVFATSRRVREHKFIYNLNDIKPFIVSLASKNKVSLVFGQEDFGLSRQDVELCDSIFYISADNSLPSYNLAFAVGITCFELFTFIKNMRQISNLELASKKDIETFFSYLKDFAAKRLDKRRLNSAVFFMRKILARTPITKSEVTLLKGLILKRFG